MHTHAVSRLRVEAELRQAIDGGQLRLYYQPIVAIRTGRTLAFEALVRWEHPTRGLLAPADFLPIAEETGLIVPMGRWILKETCRQIAEWKLAGAPDDLRVSVNVSNKQFWHGGLLQDLQGYLLDANLEPRNIVLEITETVVMYNADLAERMLLELHENGFALHIDDFGTGYSSLQALHRFPIEALKVDRSFVWGLGTDPRSTELVRTIAMMARNLGVDVIAEGIETSDQRRRVERLGLRVRPGLSVLSAGARRHRGGIRVRRTTRRRHLHRLTVAWALRAAPLVMLPRMAEFDLPARATAHLSAHPCRAAGLRSLLGRHAGCFASPATATFEPFDAGLRSDRFVRRDVPRVRRPAGARLAACTCCSRSSAALRGRVHRLRRRAGPRARAHAVGGRRLRAFRDGHPWAGQWLVSRRHS